MPSLFARKPKIQGEDLRSLGLRPPGRNSGNSRLLEGTVKNLERSLSDRSNRSNPAGNRDLRVGGGKDRFGGVAEWWNW